MQPTETPERTELVEYYVSKGSVPSVPRSTALELVKPSKAIAILNVLRRTATSNLALSLIVIVAHLALTIPWANLAAVTIVFSSRGQDQQAAIPFLLPTGDVLHFMAVGGSDANDGLAPTVGGGHGPWLTTNHNLNCGDVIIAVPATIGSPYSQNNFSPTGTVSNCPSTSGGIDGTGGIYFVNILCGGTELEACQVVSTANTDGVFSFTSNNWAVTGFKVSGGTTSGSGQDCWEPQAQTSGTIQLHHFAIINSICYNANGTFAIADGGLNHNVPGNGGDYSAVVGVIAQNANQEPICSGSIVAVGLSPVDSAVGTHIYFYNNYAINNNQAGTSFMAQITGGGVNTGLLTVTSVPSPNTLGINNIISDNNVNIPTNVFISSFGTGTGGTGTYNLQINPNTATIPNVSSETMVSGVCMENAAGGIDGEGLMVDTADAHGFTGQIVFDNNITYLSARFGFNFFYQGLNSTNLPLYITHNTLFANNSSNKGDTGGGTSGDINVQSGGSGATAIPWVTTITNNISKTHWQTAGGISGQPTLYALQMGSPITTSTIGGTGNENIFLGQAGSCLATSCDSGNNVDSYNGASFGTNIYTDPTFTNETDLLTNRIGTPNCAGFTNTTACMGYNANTQTLTTPSVISDLRASCAQCGGKGYQLPSTQCSPNSFFPTWLKGMIYQRYRSSDKTIWLYADLASKPCGL